MTITGKSEKQVALATSRHADYLALMDFALTILDEHEAAATADQKGMLSELREDFLRLRDTTDANAILDLHPKHGTWHGLQWLLPQRYQVRHGQVADNLMHMAQERWIAAQRKR